MARDIMPNSAEAALGEVPSFLPVFVVSYVLPSALFGALTFWFILPVCADGCVASSEGYALALGVGAGAALTIGAIFVLIGIDYDGWLIDGTDLQTVMRWFPLLYAILVVSQLDFNSGYVFLAYFNIAEPTSLGILFHSVMLLWLSATVVRPGSGIFRRGKVQFGMMGLFLAFLWLAFAHHLGIA